jgi:hypothetical protein
MVTAAHERCSQKNVWYAVAERGTGIGVIAVFFGSRALGVLAASIQVFSLCFKRLGRFRPVSSNGAENRAKAFSLLNRTSILLKNKRHMDEKIRFPLGVTVTARRCLHRKFLRRRVGE